MIRLISRMLAVTLSAAAVFSTVSPEAAFAAASTAEETAAESGTSPDGETSDAGALPQDTTGRDERGEQTLITRLQTGMRIQRKELREAHPEKRLRQGIRQTSKKLPEKIP